MDMIIWMLAGAVVGWVSFKYFKLGEGRGMMLSVVIGMAGGLIGGKALAPMFGVSAAVPGGFSSAVLLLALASAAGLLFIGEKVYERFGV